MTETENSPFKKDLSLGMLQAPTSPGGDSVGTVPLKGQHELPAPSRCPRLSRPWAGVGRNWRRGRRPVGAPPSWKAVLRRRRTSRASRLIPPTCWARHRSESEEAAKDVRRQREVPARQGQRLRLLPQIHTWNTAAPGKRWAPPAPATAQPGLPMLPHTSSLPGQRACCGHAGVLQVPRACPLTSTRWI